MAIDMMLLGIEAFTVCRSLLAQAFMAIDMMLLAILAIGGQAAFAGNFWLSGFLMVWCLPVPALSLTSSWSLASTGQPFNTLDLTNGPSIGNAVWTLQTFLTQ